MQSILRSHPTKPLARLLGCMLAGALCMLAFTLSPEGYVGISDPPLRAGSAEWLLYALLLGGVFRLATGTHAARLTPGMAAFGLLFGTANYFATTLFAYDTWAFLHGAAAWAQAALCILGQSVTMAAVFAVVCGWLAFEKRAVPRGGATLPAPVALPGASAAAGAHPAPSAATASATACNPPAPGASTAAHSPVANAACQPGAPFPSASGRPPLAGVATRLLGRVCRRFPRLERWARRHPTATVMLLLLACWAPFLVAFFPGTIIWDMGEMLGQLYGLREMSTWHPVFTTWLFGGCVWLGRLLHSDNLGAFLFTALQTLALAYALADSLRLLRKLGLSRPWQSATLAFFACTPIFASFAQAVGKDTLYTAALLLFALRTAQAVRFGGLRGKSLVGYALWALLACLVRTNGLYVVLGTAVGVTVLGVRGKARAAVGGALAVALAAAFAFSGLLVPALGIQDETASGLYSVCFQQSARTLRDRAATVTADEIAGIDRVLDAQALPTLYESNISDPVKYTFRQYGQGREAELPALAAYRNVWFSMLGRFPLPYLEAFVAGNSGYYAFTPKIDAARTFNHQGGIRFVFETYELGEDPRYLHTVQPAALRGMRLLLAAYARGWRRVPVLALFLFCPTYTWLLVAAGFSMARRGRFRELVAFLPALLSLGVCLLSPVNDYFRYFLPVVAMCPMLLGLAHTVAPAQAAACAGAAVR